MNLEKCPCGQCLNSSSFMISCDTCSQWYHGKCVGLFNIRGFNWDTITWHCQLCRLQQGEQLSMVLTRSLQLESEMFSLGSRLFTAFNDVKVKHLENQLSTLQTQIKELQEKQKDPKLSSEELVAHNKDSDTTNHDKMKSLENQLILLQEQIKELQEKETVLKPLAIEPADAKNTDTTNVIVNMEKEMVLKPSGIEPADTKNTGTTNVIVNMEKETVLKPVDIEPADAKSTAIAHNLIINVAKTKKQLQDGRKKKASRLSLKNKDRFSSSQGSRCKTSSWVQEVKEYSNDLSDDDFQPPKRSKVLSSQP